MLAPYRSGYGRKPLRIAWTSLLALTVAACQDPAASPREKPVYGFVADSQVATVDAWAPDVAWASPDAGSSEPGPTKPDTAEPTDLSTPDVAPPEPTDTATLDASPDVTVCQIPLQGCAGFEPTKSLTHFPIVLAHGAGGFSKVGLLEYFLFVPDTLREAGFAVYVAEVQPFSSTAARAPELAAFIDKVLECTCAEKVNIIAHSQGGMDSRFVVSTLGYGDRVASITTISTPHHGTPVADLVLGLLPEVADQLLDDVLGVYAEIVGDAPNEQDLRSMLELLSSEGAAAFAEANPDDPNVAAYSWAGRAGPGSDGMPECLGGDEPPPLGDVPMTPLLVPTWTAIGGVGGIDNDGMVPVESARWGHFRGCIPADHLSEIAGLSAVFDHLAFYVAQAQYLAEQGF